VPWAMDGHSGCVISCIFTIRIDGLGWKQENGLMKGATGLAIGCIVHYVSAQRVVPCYAAVVTRCTTRESEAQLTVDLVAFGLPGTAATLVLDVPHDVTGGHGTWHWPEVVP
jgi:hypothetical protein